MSNSKDAVRKVLDQVKADNRTSLTAPEGKLVCDAYGIPVPKEGVAKSAGEAGKMASSMGFPVVMKIVSPDILHKTEAGGVIVGLKRLRTPKRPTRPFSGTPGNISPMPRSRASRCSRCWPAAPK